MAIAAQTAAAAPALAPGPRARREALPSSPGTEAACHAGGGCSRQAWSSAPRPGSSRSEVSRPQSLRVSQRIQGGSCGGEGGGVCVCLSVCSCLSVSVCVSMYVCLCVRVMCVAM